MGILYAEGIITSGIQFDILFGPAYKGIPLVTAVAVQLSDKYKLDVPIVFNRKEAKDHGEGGCLIGATDLLRTGGKRILIVDDVISSGKAITEAVEIIRSHAPGNIIAGVIVALDRQERYQDDNRSAVQQVEQSLQAPVISISNLDSLLQNLPSDDKIRQAIVSYQDLYGVSSK